jgi:hypothetical protein
MIRLLLLIEILSCSSEPAFFFAKIRSDQISRFDTVFVTSVFISISNKSHPCCAAQFLPRNSRRCLPRKPRIEESPVPHRCVIDETLDCIHHP